MSYVFLSVIFVKSIRNYVLFSSILLFVLLYFLGLLDAPLAFLFKKTINESRLEFFNYISNYSYCFNYGCGFGILDYWTDNYSFSLVDISSIILLFLEVGYLAVFLYIILIYKLLRLTHYYSNFGSNYWLGTFFFVGLTLILSPQTAPLSTLSTYEFHISLLFIISAIKFRILKDSN